MASTDIPSLIPRRGWGADLPVAPLIPRTGVVEGIVAHYMGSDSYAKADTISTLKWVQRFHVKDRGWRDIAYNYAISNGQIYELRGYDFQNGAHGGHEGRSANLKKIAVLFILGATDELSKENQEAFMTLHKAVSNRVNRRKFVRNRKTPVICHRDINDTMCPGNTITNYIRAFDAGSPDVRNYRRFLSRNRKRN